MMSVPAWQLKPISRRPSSSIVSRSLFLYLKPATRIQLFSKLPSCQSPLLAPSSLRNVATIGYVSRARPTLIPHPLPRRLLFMSSIRSHSKTPRPQEKGIVDAKDHKHDNNLNGKGLSHEEHEEHSHSHSHSIFGHSHSHGEEGHSKDAEQIIAALKGKGDRGSYITLVGLFSNVALTGAKGLAGWYMHSASLLADAGHSMSDLLGDFVTLFCWKLSRRPPSERYPYGFAKFETLGTTTISLLLIGGALGIGFHSYHLFITALGETAVALPPGQLQEMLQTFTSTAAFHPSIGHQHVHSVDPNAAWFALMGILSKEWLYRITKVVADEEKSPVLLANAIHHRSDAYSSLVAFFAILGTWVFPAFPLDPIGGLIVAVVILRQGIGLLAGAWGDLTDAGVSSRTKRSLSKVLEPLLDKSSNPTEAALPSLLSIHHLRARHAGSLMFVDLTAEVKGSITVSQATALEEKIEKTLKTARKEITEVRITFRPSSEKTPL